MKTISILEFRLHTERILGQIQKGERMILTRRGKPVARLEPIVDPPLSDDTFYSLTDLAEPGESLDNRQIDALLYAAHAEATSVAAGGRQECLPDDYPTTSFTTRPNTSVKRKSRPE
jgi:antitoxin (DNA-binding transcriptional repressor) of toxin-antitoxin stability system